MWNAGCVFLDGITFQVLGPCLEPRAVGCGHAENGVISFAALGNSLATSRQCPSAHAESRRARGGVPGAGGRGPALHRESRVPEYRPDDAWGVLAARDVLGSGGDELGVSATAVLVNIVGYPCVDYNLYKAIHCLVNMPLTVKARGHQRGPEVPVRADVAADGC